MRSALHSVFRLPSSFGFLLGLAAFLTAVNGAPPDEARAWRILPAGDSITEGGSSFANWRYQLWEKLTAAGYSFEYVGSRSTPSRVGPLAHEGYGGKNIETLEQNLTQTIAAARPDIVLLHAGHNHFAEEKPVPGILAATERIVALARATNPRVIVLVAQVIPSLKLPKYSYIAELNAELPALAARLDTPESPVRIVDHATGFDPAVDTVADLVHPNEAGARKMTRTWFEALVKVLPTPPPAPAPGAIIPYKTAAGRPLTLHVFRPETRGERSSKDAPRPAIVFFFGGGWTSGTPLQFYPECRHFAAQGYVAIAADYRTSTTFPKTTPFDAVSDAKSAVRYLRSHATELGIDPARIVAAGASAGGHLAAAAALVPGLDDPSDDLQVSPKPSALLLWYPVVDNGPTGYGQAAIGGRFREISPLHNIGAEEPPPTLFLLGDQDALVPVSTAREFQSRLRAAGARCDLVLIEGRPHPIYNYRASTAVDLALRAECLAKADAFLGSLGLP